ncbi:uncharacterized protein LOC120415807 isoform X2 [Culex pipiens pallens]|uniref:uncharacterized protein LOC120415807 isoform X2 n=1 Tax=Culex pipiens pallens TaxID=42434 RepID=UPI001952DFAC|nr:uncharacterized protein LOC120415807 isoform X2 [Culex pipiens pallens]
MALLVVTAFPRPRWQPTLGWALGAALLLTSGVNGGYPRDVELIEPVTGNLNRNDPPPKVARGRHHYPSYVKGQDPVEEYNRRRLHVDTSRYLSGHREAPSHWDGHRQLEAEGRALRERYGRRSGVKSDRLQRQKKVQHREGVDRGRGVKGRQKVKDPIKRRVGRRVQLDMDAPRRYEESDPHVFSYERAEPVVEGDEDSGRQASLPDDVKFFHYLNFFGDGSFNAGSKRGNDQHYVEQHERGSRGAGIFQKRVKWADKKGGFGEHYWDLNHVTS